MRQRKHICDDDWSRAFSRRKTRSLSCKIDRKQDGIIKVTVGPPRDRNSTRLRKKERKYRSKEEKEREIGKGSLRRKIKKHVRLRKKKKPKNNKFYISLFFV